MPRTIKLPAQIIERAAASPDSLDKANRTVDIVVSTGAVITRYHPAFYEVVDETLEISENAIRLEYYNSGRAPILNVHNASDIKAQFGRVIKSWVEGSALLARLQFDENPESEEVWQRVQRGELPNYSVGAWHHKYSDITADGDTIRSVVAVDWEPREVSIAPMGKDDGAVVRSSGNELTPCIIENATSAKSEEHMPEPIKPVEPVAPVVPVVDPTLVTQADHVAEVAAAEARGRQAAGADNDLAITSERQRCADVRDVCTRSAMSPEFAEKHVTAGTSVADLNALVINEIAERSDDNPVTSRVRIMSNEKDTIHAGLENSLAHRADPGAVKLDDNGKRFYGANLMDIARASMGACGIMTNDLHGMELAKRAFHGSDDFSILLSNLASNTMTRAYEAAPKTFMPFCRRVTLGDFKPQSRIKLGDAPSLELVGESGEFHRGTIGEDKEAIQLKTYGKIVGFTRQALINDDMDGLTRVPQMFGRRAAELENFLVWSIIINNPNMNDGVALFHANHNNVGTGAIDVAGLSLAKRTMRKQVGLDGGKIRVQPKYLIVPTDLEEVAEQYLFNALNPAQPSQVNPHSGKYELIVEPLLDDSSAVEWYMSADPGAIDTLEFGYLNGSEGLQLETRNGFDIDGLEIKARQDFGAAPIETRGLYQSSGV